MIFLKLAFKSLSNRLFSSSLTIVSISLSVMLVLTVEVTRRGAQEGFTQTISKTDLIVGARSGPLQLLLYSVFNIGTPTHNISFEAYQKIKEHPAIEWTVPFSLGDGHRGYRVVGTNEDFFKYYRFRGGENISFSSGRKFEEIWDVVVGSEVAEKLGYKLGDSIIVSHGVTKGEGVLHHSDKPFVISGILDATGTPLDRSIYVSLQGVEALHVDERSRQGGKSSESRDSGHEHHHHHHHERKNKSQSNLAEDFHVHSISAFFVGAKSRIESLKIQREINSFKDEPVMAILPTATLTELWEGLSYAEGVLKLISSMVLLVSFVGMLIALTATLNERRREMAILRSIGASSLQVAGLLVFESALLTFSGILLGSGMSLAFFEALKPVIENKFGLYLEGHYFSLREFLYLGVTFFGGILLGLLPAMRAMKLSLKDGLSVRH